VSTILPPAPQLPPDLDSAPDPEALIEEARRRARRRRALYALASGDQVGDVAFARIGVVGSGVATLAD